MSSPRLGPGPSDWVTAFLFGGFFLIALPFSLVAPRKGLEVLFLSGGMSAIAIRELQWKLRRVDESPIPLHVPAGVDLHPSRKLLFACAIWMIFVGPALFDCEPDAGSLGRFSGYYFTILGVWFLYRTIKGTTSLKKFIRFDEAAYTIGKNPFRMSFAWDNIARARVAAFNGKAVLLLELRDAGAVAVEPSSRRPTWDAIAARNRKTWGADVASDIEDFGYGAPQMAATIRRYVEQPEARAELA